MAKFKPLPPLKELQQAFDYDPSSGVFRNGYTKSNRALEGAVAGYVPQHGYLTLRYQCRQLLASRVAWFLMTGIDPLDKEVEHKDRIRTNNRFDNLRLASRSQNNNNKMSKGWTKSGDRYVARIRVNGQETYLGRFDTPDEAHAAYVAKHVEIHGEFSPHRGTVCASPAERRPT